MVTRWFMGRMMKRELANTIYSTRKNFPADIQKRFSRHVLEKMSFVHGELKSNGKSGEIRALQTVAKQATAERHIALDRGANSSKNSAWNLASLVESWAFARLAFIQGRVSAKAFDDIDAILWDFISDNLNPHEIAKICGLTEETIPSATSDPKPPSTIMPRFNHGRAQRHERFLAPNILAAVAAADGSLHDSEIKTIVPFLTKLYGQEFPSSHLYTMFDLYREQPELIYTVIEDLKQVCSKDAIFKAFETGCLVAIVDGEFVFEEHATLRKIGIALDIPDDIALGMINNARQILANINSME